MPLNLDIEALPKKKLDFDLVLQEPMLPQPKEELYWEAAKPPTLADKLKNFLTKVGLAKSPEEQIAEAQNKYAQEKTGVNPQDVFNFPLVDFNNPVDRKRFAIDQSFAKGLIGKQLPHPEIAEEHPVLSAIGNGAGELMGLASVGGALGGITKKLIADGIAKFGIRNLPKIMLAARASQGAATFGLKEAGEKVLKGFRGEELGAKDIGEVAGEAAFGGGLGAVGSIAKPLLRIPAEMLYGYTTSKIQGADNLNAAVNAGVFGLFGVMNRADLGKEYRLMAIKEISDNLAAKATEFGVDPGRARAAVDNFVYKSATEITGEKDITKAFDKILSSKENNLKYFDALNERIKALTPKKQLPISTPSKMEIVPLEASQVGRTGQEEAILEPSTAIPSKPIIPTLAPIVPGKPELPENFPQDITLPGLLKDIASIEGAKPEIQQPLAGGMTHKIPEQVQKWLDKGITVAERQNTIRIVDPEAQVKDISGNVVDLPKGHEMTPYKLSNGKIWLHDGKNVVIEAAQLKQLANKNLVLGEQKVSPELQPLYEEAKKHGSAEELINSLEYHGTTKANAAKIRKEGFKVGEGQAGISTTQGADEAADYGDTVIPVLIRKDAEMVGTPGKDFLTGTGNWSPSDVIVLPEGTTPEQLTDIWNKAQQSKQQPMAGGLSFSKEGPENKVKKFPVHHTEEAEAYKKELEAKGIKAEIEEVNYDADLGLPALIVRPTEIPKQAPSIDVDYKNAAEEFDALSIDEQAELAERAGMGIEMADIAKSPKGNLFVAIKELGKIKPYRGSFMAEELKEIPAYLKDKNAAHTLDTIIRELKTFGWHFESDRDIMQAIIEQRDHPIQKIDRAAMRWILRRFEHNKKAKEIFLEKYIKKIEETLSKPISANKVKKIVREATGQVKVVNLIREDYAYKELLKTENETYKRAYREGELNGKEETAARYENRIEAKKTREEIKKYTETIKKIDTSEMASPHKEAIEEIQDVVDWAVPTKKTLTHLSDIRDYLRDNPNAELPDYVYEDLKRLQMKNRENMTVDEFRSLAETVQHYAHLDSLKKKIKARQKLVEFEEARAESIKQMRPPKKIEEDIIKTPAGDKLKDIKSTGEKIIRLFGINQEHYDLIIESISGENSVTFDILFNNVKEGIRDQLALRHKLFDMFSEKMKEAGVQPKDLAKWRNEKVITGKFTLTRGERISLYLHSKNENNLRHVLGEGIVFREAPDARPRKITEEELQTILDSLTPDERKIGDLNTLMSDEIYKDMAKVFYEKNGFDLPKEENYFGIKVARTSLSGEKQEREALEAFRDQFVRPGIRKGFLKKRVKSEAAIMLDDFFAALNDHIEHAAAYVGLELPLSNASKLFFDKDWKAEFVSRYGNDVWGHIHKGLRDIAGDYQNYSDLDQAFVKFKNQITKAIFGLNPSIILKQTLSYPLFNVYVEGKYLMRGFFDYITQWHELIERHKLYSPEFRERIEFGFERDVSDVFKSKTTGKLLGQGRTLSEKTLLGIQIMDKHVTAAGMQGAILQELDKLKNSGLSPEEKLKRAYSFADYVVNRTQSTYAIEHRSPLSRGNPWEKMFTFASTDSNQGLNLLRRTWRQYYKTKDPEDLRRFTKVLFYLSLVIPVGISVIDYLNDWLYRKNKKPKFSGWYFTKEYLNQTTGHLYFINYILTSMLSKLESGTWLGRDISNPVESTVNNLIDTAVNGIEGVAKKDSKKIEKFIDGAASFGFMAAGLPYTTPKKIITAPFRKEESKEGDFVLGKENRGKSSYRLKF